MKAELKHRSSSFLPVYRRCDLLHTILSTNLTADMLKVSKFQNDSMKSSFLPKYETKIIRISAL